MSSLESKQLEGLGPERIEEHDSGKVQDAWKAGPG